MKWTKFNTSFLSRVSVNRKAVALLCVSFVSLMVYAGPAKTVYSKANPSVWTTNSHWSSTSGGGSCGCTPDESKDVIYLETNTSSTAGLTFGASVTLTVRNNSTLTVNGNAVFSNGAVIAVEAGSSLVITGNLTNNNNSNQVSINGSLSVGGNFDGGNGSSVSGTGSMSVTGTATTTGSGTVFGSNGGCSGCVISPSSPLPVEFLFFSAAEGNNSIVLDWSTAAEFNSDYFIVQRSKDGVSFQNVATVHAAGNSSTVKTYSSVDNEPYSGTSFYRLKQVDLDGKFTFSDIVTVKFQEAGMVEVYPNPTSGPFSILMQGKENDEVLIVVRNVLGQEFYSNVIIVQNNNRIIAVDPGQKLAAGVYTVIATSSEGLYQSKIVVR